MVSKNKVTKPQESFEIPGAKLLWAAAGAVGLIAILVVLNNYIAAKIVRFSFFHELKSFLTIDTASGYAFLAIVLLLVIVFAFSVQIGEKIKIPESKRQAYISVVGLIYVLLLVFVAAKIGYWGSGGFTSIRSINDLLQIAIAFTMLISLLAIADFSRSALDSYLALEKCVEYAQEQLQKYRVADQQAVVRPSRKLFGSFYGFVAAFFVFLVTGHALEEKLEFSQEFWINSGFLLLYCALPLGKLLFLKKNLHADLVFGYKFTGILLAVLFVVGDFYLYFLAIVGIVLHGSPGELLFWLLLLLPSLLVLFFQLGYRRVPFLKKHYDYAMIRGYNNLLREKNQLAAKLHSEQ